LFHNIWTRNEFDTNFRSFETDLTILENRKGISLPQIGHWAKIGMWPSATVRSWPAWSDRHSSAGLAQRGSAHEGAATALSRARTRVRLRCALHALSSRSDEATDEWTAAHSGQGLPGECYRLKAHTPGKLWSSNSRRAKVAAERGDTHWRSEEWVSEF
jgi:hypothetical protein